MREIPIHVTYTLTRVGEDGNTRSERLAVRCGDIREAMAVRRELYETPGTSYIRTNRSGRLAEGTRLTGRHRGRR